MILDNLNTFLATAIGGLLFKWLAGAVKSCWVWLHKVYPEEKFLVEQLNISPIFIRLSHMKYKKSTKKYQKKQKISYTTIGTIIIVLFLYFFYSFSQLLIKGPIYWIDYKVKETNDLVWMRPNEVTNPFGTSAWKITPEICKDDDKIKKILTIKPQTKEFVCGYMLDPQKRDELEKATNKNTISIISMSTILYLAMLFFISIGCGMIIDVYINKKITILNESEIERYKQYLT